ncbi:MAG: hypothetical protein ABR577_02280 [Pyrinomonadaceae bacterium]
MQIESSLLPLEDFAGKVGVYFSTARTTAADYENRFVVATLFTGQLPEIEIRNTGGNSEANRSSLKESPA